MPRRNVQRRKRCKFCANQFTIQKTEAERDKEHQTERPTENKESDPVCLRQKKIDKKDGSLPPDDDDKVDSENFNIIINFDILKQFISDVTSCPDCESKKLLFQNHLQLCMGLANKLSLSVVLVDGVLNFYFKRMLCLSKQTREKHF